MMLQRRTVLVAIIGMAALVAVGAGLASASSGVGSPTTIHVIEHATTDVVIDVGQTGDSTGDLLTFHNQVFDETNTNPVGNDQGDCIRIDPRRGTWECRWVTRLDGGSITVEGPFVDTRNTVFAVTGGTGIYRDARGQMALNSLAGGTEYDFIFSLIP